MSTYSTILTSNAFLTKALSGGVPLTHMKLQKLVFFVYAWSLAIHGRSFVNESPQAWPYGPVFASLYPELKPYGSGSIDQYLLQPGDVQPMIPNREDREFWGLLEQVWERYSPLTAYQLSDLTHEPGGPWEVARYSGQPFLNDEGVKQYYQGKL